MPTCCTIAQTASCAAPNAHSLARAACLYVCSTVAYWVPMGNEEMQAYGREELERTGLNKGWMSFSRTARLARGEMLSKMKDQEGSDESKQ